MQETVFPDNGILVNPGACINDGSITDLYIFSDINMGVDAYLIPDFHILTHISKGSDIDIIACLHIFFQKSQRMYPNGFRFVLFNKGKQGGQGFIRIIYPYQGRLHRFFRLKILVYKNSRSFCRIHIFCIDRIRQKGEFARPGFFYFTKACQNPVPVSFHFTFQVFRNHLNCIFHFMLDYDC